MQLTSAKFTSGTYEAQRMCAHSEGAWPEATSGASGPGGTCGRGCGGAPDTKEDEDEEEEEEGREEEDEEEEEEDEEEEEEEEEEVELVASVATTVTAAASVIAASASSPLASGGTVAATPSRPGPSDLPFTATSFARPRSVALSAPPLTGQSAQTCAAASRPSAQRSHSQSPSGTGPRP